MATYMTIGQVKTVNLPDCTFTIEPLSDYRFKAEDGKDDTWQIIFEPKDGPTNGSLELKLVDEDRQFKLKCGGTANTEKSTSLEVIVASGFASAMVVLKADRTKIRLLVDEADFQSSPVCCTIEVL